MIIRSMLPRFFAPDLDPDDEITLLPAAEARHLTRVLRLAAGDAVAVFDGRGTEFRAVVEVAVRDTASLRLIERVPVPDAPAVQIVLVQAVLKGNSMDDAVRDATMMGVEAIEPVLTARTDVKSAIARRAETLHRWERIALASAKQSRRATLPRVDPPRTLEEWLASPSVEMKLLFVEPSIDRGQRPMKTLLDHVVPTRAAVLVGPEGGWAAQEIDAAIAAGATPLSLGRLTLRAESMAIAALSALNAIWEQ
jgi:16S rRNA (uracil1498-N3)-methyltransferase